MLIVRKLFLAILAAVALYPQGVLERSRAALPEDERKAIEDARRGAKPRPFSSRKTPLNEPERERVKAFERAKNSVVQITAPGINPAAGQELQAQTFGSGVIWDESGHIVTNYHLISAKDPSAEKLLVETMGLSVRASDGAEYEAKLIGAAPESDLALIAVEVFIKGAMPISLGRSSELVVGQSVLALGNPFGYDYSLTSGIVSALDRAIPSPANTPINGVIQTDAALNRGNSGGPLLNYKGQMVGLNTGFISPSGWNAGLNYAIPSDMVIAEIAKLLESHRTAESLSPLTPKERACAEVFNQAKQSVVGVHAMERYRDFWTGGVLVDPVGSGTGVLWDTEGHIITNFHVVAMQDPLRGGFKTANVITVTTSDNQEIAARVIGVRPDIDIAVLIISRLPDGIRPIPIGSASGLTIGQYVLALGNPFGNDHSLSGGVISALNRTIDSPSGNTIKGVLQTDAAINPGNSGGPLLDLNGRLLGINAMIISSTGVNAKVGFAIPVDLICREIEDITGAREISDITAPQMDGEARDRASVFKKARDSVVYVHAETRKFDARDNWSGNIFRLPPASGTGIVWDARGHIVTSYSTVLMSDLTADQIAEADKLTVTLANGNTYLARIVGRSLEYNIAVLRVFAPFKDLRPLPLSRAGDLKVGQDLLALGNPFGMDHSLSIGILSAERDLSANFRGVIQTDAAINPGNIGGPILDSAGNLAGMGFFMEGPGSHSGINFALSTKTLNRVVPLLLAKGQVERPSLGFVSASLLEARYLYKVEKGVLIKSVDPDSPASRAGLRGLRPSETGNGFEPGDIIVGLRGKPVDNSEALWDLIEQEPSGAPLPFDVLRDRKRAKIVVRP